MSFEHWTPEQWAVFTITVAAGIVAAVVLAVLHRTRYYDTPAWVDPRGMLTEQRRPAPRVIAPATWVDPMVADYTERGIGALSSIQAMTVDPTLRTAAEVQAEEDMWINAYSDLTYFMPETDAAREQMRINLEPAMRTARLWLMRAGEVGARAALSTWRMDTPTGEYAAIDRQQLMARALLVS
jgi:hypothetical protein